MLNEPKSERRYAVESRADAEARRIAFMIEHMADNKAYRYAVRRAGGDADASLLDGHRVRFKRYRSDWRDQPRRAIADALTGDAFAASGAAPLCVDIEVASICDLACPFCFRQHIATPDKIIGEDLFRRIVDQCAELNVPSIKLNWRGEPLLHPKLPELVDYAKRSGVLEVIINTNAVTLHEKTARALIKAGLDLMIYSFDGGTRQTYEKMRVGRFHENSFDAVYANIRRFADIREEMGSDFPRTKIQMILTEDTFSERESFFALFEDCVDDVSVKAYTERGGRLPDLDAATKSRIEPLMKEHGIDHNAAYWRDLAGNIHISRGRLPCEQPYQRLMVSYDGRVSMCCYDWGCEMPVGLVDGAAIEKGDADYRAVKEAIQSGKAGFAEFMSEARMPEPAGDLPKSVTSLAEIWVGAEIDAVRKKHVGGSVEAVDICRRCPFKETYEWLTIESPTGDGPES